MARAIREARARKPILASVNSQAASAAYWLASQATSVSITPGGAVGSIGIFMLHADMSRALDQAAVTMTLIAAGEGKTYGNPYEPLADGARAQMTARVNQIYDQFVGDVARGRNSRKLATR